MDSLSAWYVLPTPYFALTACELGDGQERPRPRECALSRPRQCFDLVKPRPTLGEKPTPVPQGERGTNQLEPSLDVVVRNRPAQRGAQIIVLGYQVSRIE